MKSEEAIELKEANEGPIELNIKNNETDDLKLSNEEPADNTLGIIVTPNEKNNNTSNNNEDSLNKICIEEKIIQKPIIIGAEDTASYFKLLIKSFIIFEK